jgi:hypothetical protein
MRRRTGVMCFVPTERQLEKAFHERCRHTLSDQQGAAALQDAAGAVKQPAAASNYQHHRQPKGRVAKTCRAMKLQGVKGFSRDVRHRQQNHLRTGEQSYRAHEDATLASQLPPDVAVQVEYGSRSKDTGLGGDVHSDNGIGQV